VALTTYNIGNKVIHQVFGEGLVVDVRPRDFFDILEIAFSDGVRKVTSIHPQLRLDETEIDKPPEEPDEFSLTSALLNEDEDKPEEITPAPQLSLPEQRLRAAKMLDPLQYEFNHSRILAVDHSSLKPYISTKDKDGSNPQELYYHLKGLQIARRRGFEQLLSLNHVRDVQRLEHQIRACLRVLREMKGRALLADEVGLGKTIEAGLIMKEYLLRTLVQTILILVPASLVTQWREELRHKFDIPAHLYKRDEPWDTHPIIIASLDTAKSARNREAIAARGFDMLIVDEAHRLRNHLTQAWKFIDSLSLKYLLLLTATPVQNDLRELYNLITLLRPGMLGTYRSFRKEYVVRGDRRLPQNTRRLSQILADVMIRTTRSSTSIQFPRREVQTLQLEQSPDEKEFYQAVSIFIRDMSTSVEKRRGQLPWPLLLVVLQKEIGSSTAAAIGTLEKALSGRLRGEKRRLSELLELGESVRNHVKFDALADLISSPQHKNDKVIVFTQFRRTIQFLVESLEAKGLDTVTFHGSMTHTAKDQAIERFRRDANILISSEAGGEGRNLQFCNTMVNYDLPWNPMRVEQRIGRIHRIGQTRDVFIYNLSLSGTLESYVLSVLMRKINMFQLVIGEMDQILGNLDWDDSFETRVFQLWAMNNNEEELEKAFTKLGNEVETAVDRYSHVKVYDEEIFGGADHIHRKTD
jgi:SNF2 family DNA or RNA helicase